MNRDQLNGLAAVARGRLALVHAARAPSVVVETPAMHVRNALQCLTLFSEANPAVWAFSPELRSAVARLLTALFAMEDDERRARGEAAP